MLVSSGFIATLLALVSPTWTSAAFVLAGAATLFASEPEPRLAPRGGRPRMT